MWKLPHGTCTSSTGTLSPLPNEIALPQDAMQNCSYVMPGSCGGYRGQMKLACRTSTLSVTVSSGTNGSEVKCYNADHANIRESDEPLGSAIIQLVHVEQDGMLPDVNL